MKGQPNALISEKSPYLLQHAYNPVNWQPWGDQALKQAQVENKLIFLSIGYSTCHWCHVMERESFEDEQVAEILNQHYVAIKVEREERPDIDHVYMTVCQSLTGQGGWPLTIIMTPAREPIFAGTYFPRQSRWGRPGLIDILQQISGQWTTDPAGLRQLGQEIVEVVRSELSETAPGTIQPDVINQAVNELKRRFDPRYGGFGTAPKFPTPHQLMLLLRWWKQTDDQEIHHMVEKTLTAMYRGGIYDHVGFGFARYSTDDKWLVPHFEKMLYDNALLAYTYLEGYQAINRDEYGQIAEEIFTFVLREMTDPEGGFYSAIDADSEGVEGKYYVWTPQEIVDVLGAEDGQVFCELYNISEKGNFDGKSIPT